MARIEELLDILIEKGASDLHLSDGNPPLLRLHGHLEPILTAANVKAGESYESLVLEILEPTFREKFLKTGDVDIAYAYGDKARFRVNIFRQKNGIGAVMRMIPSKITTLQALSMPAILDRVIHMRQGLVLVTGPTGSGKS